MCWRRSQTRQPEPNLSIITWLRCYTSSTVSSRNKQSEQCVHTRDAETVAELGRQTQCLLTTQLWAAASANLSAEWCMLHSDILAKHTPARHMECVERNLQQPLKHKSAH